jgi:hypothetical protein
MCLSYAKIFGLSAPNLLRPGFAPSSETPNFASAVLNCRLRPVVLNAGSYIGQAGKLHRASREANVGQAGTKWQYATRIRCASSSRRDAMKLARQFIAWDASKPNPSLRDKSDTSYGTCLPVCDPCFGNSTGTGVKCCHAAMRGQSYPGTLATLSFRFFDRTWGGS